MKVLYIDLMSPIGHKNYNYGLLKPLTKKHKVDLLIRKNFLELKENNINYNNIYILPDEFIPEIIVNKYSNMNLFKIMYRIKQLKAISWIKKNFNFKKYDLVFFSSVDIISFSIAMRKFNGRCAFIDHAISDIDESKIKTYFWKKINKQLEVIVLEPYIKEYIKNKLNINNKIWILPHPLPKIEIGNDYSREKKEEILIFSPGYGNDEMFIEYLIRNESKIPENFRIVIRSATRNEDYKKLKVYNSRIADKEYYENMINANYILLAYGDNYNYKTSGVLFEAIALKKKVLIRNNNTLKYYTKMFPFNISEFKEFEDIFNVILNKKFKNEKEENYNTALEYYSEKSIENNFDKILKK